MLPFKNGNFYNIAIAILDISLLLPFSYRSSNFAIAKVFALYLFASIFVWVFILVHGFFSVRNGNLFAIAVKSEKERQLMYLDSWKSENFRKRAIKVMTLQGAIEKSLILKIWMIGWHHNYFEFDGNNNICADCIA